MSKSNYYTVYKITNKVNKKIYIGAHKTHNLNDKYMGSGVAIKRALLKYGIDNFSKEILYILNTEDEMYLKEKEIVNKSFVKRKDTYNMTEGGFGGWSHLDTSSFGLHMKQEKYKLMVSNQQKQSYIDHPERILISKENLKKAVIASTGRIKSPEERQKLSHSIKNIPNRLELNREISKRVTKQWADDDFKKSVSINLRKTWTKERRKKHGELLTGKDNPMYKGYYITPLGNFHSLKEAYTVHKISKPALMNRCKYQNDKIITKRSISLSPDLNLEDNSDMIGKTWKECGWSFQLSSR